LKLEHFHKNCSHAVGKIKERSFWQGFGSVTGRSWACSFAKALPKTPKILAPHGYSISSNALNRVSQGTASFAAYPFS
jgi:hypothetical protein